MTATKMPMIDIFIGCVSVRFDLQKCIVFPFFGRLRQCQVDRLSARTRSRETKRIATTAGTKKKQNKKKIVANDISTFRCRIYEEWWPPKTCFETWNSCKGSLSVLCCRDPRCNAHTCTTQFIPLMECGLHSNCCLRIGAKNQKQETTTTKWILLKSVFYHFFFVYALRWWPNPHRFLICPLVLPLSFALLRFLLINDDDGILCTAKRHRQINYSMIFASWQAFAKHTN